MSTEELTTIRSKMLSDERLEKIDQLVSHSLNENAILHKVSLM